MLKVLAAAVTRALVWRRVDIFVTATPHLSRRGVRCQLGRNVPLDNVNIGITTQDTDHSAMRALPLQDQLFLITLDIQI